MTVIASVDTQLVSFTARDGRLLDGLLYEPSQQPVASVVHLHGKGGNCYSGPSRFIPARTTTAPIRQLALNMRCHDLAYTRTDIAGVDFHHGDPALAGGGCWELVSEGPQDVPAGVDLLRELGPEPVFVCGHSSGGFYTATHAAQDQSLAGRIVLSPLVSNKRPLPLWFGTAEQLEAALADARRMVAEGNGDLLIPLPCWYYAISARSLVERADEADDVWVASVQASASPLLMLWGTAESRAPMWAELFDKLTVPQRQQVAIDGAEHSYHGFEDAVAAAVAEFVLAHAR